MTQMNTQFAVQQLMNDSFTACVIAGQDKEITTTDKHKQLSYIQSEVDELSDAIIDCDTVEQLDACVDILVTVFGFMQKLQKQGAMLDKAMIKTGKNNITKFPSGLDLELAEETVKFYKETKNKDCTIHFNPEYHCYVIRDANGKYMKCKGFIENDLSDCFEQNV